MARENGRKRLLVSWAEIEQMVSAAAVIDDCRCELAARNRNIVSEVLADTWPPSGGTTPMERCTIRKATPNTFITYIP